MVMIITSLILKQISQQRKTVPTALTKKTQQTRAKKKRVQKKVLLKKEAQQKQTEKQIQTLTLIHQATAPKAFPRMMR